MVHLKLIHMTATTKYIRYISFWTNIYQIHKAEVDVQLKNVKINYMKIIYHQKRMIYCNQRILMASRALIGLTSKGVDL